MHPVIYQPNCIFCQRDKIREDILWEFESFYVKVGLAIVGPGHVMLISKSHLSCFAEMPLRLVSEYEKAKKLVSRILTRIFSSPFLIEYGIWGQSVNHAHTHFIPSEGPGYRIKSILREMFLRGKRRAVIEIADHSRLREIYLAEKGYVIVEENSRMYVAHVDRIPDDPEIESLNYRAFFKKCKGLAGVGDWREMSQEEMELDEKKRSATKAAWPQHPDTNPEFAKPRCASFRNWKTTDKRG